MKLNASELYLKEKVSNMSILAVMVCVLGWFFLIIGLVEGEMEKTLVGWLLILTYALIVFIGA